ALDVPVVGLFGPTDPARNGPYSTDASRHIVLRNPHNRETTYRRGKAYSPAMLSLGVPQVADAIARRWGKES
ncbi:MAG: glycosyltransferase family 9 protein, partial [Candidatus Acidiferrales bacterium]